MRLVVDVIGGKSVQLEQLIRMNLDRTKEIVRIQVEAARLQRTATLMPAENFFANMIGHMGIVYGPEVAAQILTMFEMTKNDHDEMIDGMMREPRKAAKAFQDGVRNWQAKRRT